MSENYKELSRALRNRLLEAGCRYEISHSRILHGFSGVNNDGNLDNVLSRPEFVGFIKQNKFVVLRNNGDDDLKYGYYVCPCGGFTRATIIYNNIKVVHGKHNFGPHSHFVKSAGVFKALCKAAAKLENGAQIIRDAINDVKAVEHQVA